MPDVVNHNNKMKEALKINKDSPDISRIRQEEISKFNDVLKKHRIKRINDVLSKKQFERIQQLIIQMIGPKIMLCNIADVKSLNISPPLYIGCTLGTYVNNFLRYK